MHDILIRGGTLFDGAGHPGAAGDLAIEGDRIVAIGGSLSGAARKTTDAEGLAVAPGFIDIKTHSDFTLPITASSALPRGWRAVAAKSFRVNFGGITHRCP